MVGSCGTEVVHGNGEVQLLLPAEEYPDGLLSGSGVRGICVFLRRSRPCDPLCLDLASASSSSRARILAVASSRADRELTSLAAGGEVIYLGVVVVA